MENDKKDFGQRCRVIRTKGIIQSNRAKILREVGEVNNSPFRAIHRVDADRVVRRHTQRRKSGSKGGGCFANFLVRAEKSV